MTWSYPVGHIFGSEIRIHATFPLLLIWIGMSAWLTGGAVAAVYAVLFILALFACVVAHELGHALMARRFGIATPDVTLLPIGGVARLERMPEDPVQEIWVAVAGPAVNVVIWAALSLVSGGMPDLALLQQVGHSPSAFVAQLAATNLILVLFNLIPAFPMDGGRVLRAVLTLWLGRSKATGAAAGIGQAVAVAFGIVGLLTGNILLLFVAFFVFAAATAETSDVQMRDLAADVPAREAMITVYESLRPDDLLMAMSSALLRTTQHEFPVLDTDGRLLGFVTRDAIFQAAGQGGQTRAAEVMRTDIPRIKLTAKLSEALDAMSQPDVPAVAVCGKGGAFLGYITRENFGEWMILRRQRLAHRG